MIIIIPNIEELLSKLVPWQRGTLTFLIQSEEEYNDFIEYYENEEIQQSLHSVKLNEYSRASQAMQRYRLDRIVKMALSFEEFKKLFEENPYTGFSTLFQDGVDGQTLKLIKKRMAEGTSLEMFYEYHLLDPHEFLKRLATFRIDRDLLYLLQKRTKSSEQHLNRLDMSIDDVIGYNSISVYNHKLREVFIQRMVRDTKMAKKIKILYKSTCQLCRSKIKSTNGYISEAHHIKPYNITHKGDDSYQNLIVLCPNCHSRFDEYFYAIHPETFTVHCLDTGNENHMKDLYMVKDHTLGQEYLNFAWEVFIGLKDSLNKDNK